MRNQRSAIPLILSVAAIAAALAGCAPSVPSASPPTELTFDDYYILERNQRAGVVNSQGEQVLPFAFAGITALSPYGPQFIKIQSKTQFFLCVPYTVSTADSEPGDESAVLYDSSGKAVGDGRYYGGYWLDDNLLALLKVDGKDFSFGVLETSGRQVVPFQYSEVLRFGRYIVGCDMQRDCLDIYRDDGSLEKSIQEPLYGVSAGNGYLQVTRPSGMALMDENLQWLFYDGYPYIVPAGGGIFIAGDGRGYRLVDGQGRDLLGKAYETIDTVTGDDEQVTGFIGSTRDSATVAAYDKEGKLLFERSGYTSLRASGPYYIATQGIFGHVLDGRGNVLFAHIKGDAQYWLEEAGLFYYLNQDHNGGFYVRPDGTLLPLPEDTYCQFLCDNRFIASVIDGLTGLCDNEGKWIAEPRYASVNPVYGDRVLPDGSRKKLLIVGNGNLYGIIDEDGRQVIPMVFDRLYMYGGGLLHAEKGERTGLMNLNGHWIWYTSDYEQLDD